MAPRTDTTQQKWLVVGAVLVVVAVLLIAVLAVGLVRRSREATVPPPASPATSQAPEPPGTSPSGSKPTGTDGVVESTGTVVVDGRERSYLVMEPSARGDGEVLPWVLVLHGLGISAKETASIGGWEAAVGRDRFVAVFAQGTSNSWNMGRCCPPASLDGVDDVAYLDAVMDDVGQRAGVDPSRQYLVGFSNGALMAYRYACDRSERFAAVATMAGSNISECLPTVPVSLLHAHALDDLVVPYHGGLGAGSLLTAQLFPPVADGVAAWARADGCDPTPVTETDADDIRWTRWAGCTAGTRVELAAVPGVGHDWLRRGDFDAMDALVDFFGLSG